MKVLNLLSFITLLFCSCNNETITENPLDSVSKTDKQIISALGFDITSLVDKGTFYVVEGDIMFEKKSLNEYNTPRLKQVRSSGALSRNIRNITVGVSNSLKVSGKNHWLTEIQQAMNEWNNISPECGIIFRYTTEASPDIMISDDGGILEDNWLAVGSYPKNYKPGATIKINLDFWSGYTLTSSQKKYNMVHELGHCIGFMHTNWSHLGESTGRPIPGTPNSGSNPDPNSVMNGETPTHSWNGFSKYDIIAAIDMHPSFVPELTMRKTSAMMSRNVRVITLNLPYDPIYLEATYTYQWTLDNTGYYGQEAYPAKTSIRIIPTKFPHTVTAVVSDSYGKRSTISETFYE